MTTRAEMVKRAEELARKIRETGGECPITGVEGVDMAIYVKSQEFAIAQANFKRQTELRERARKGYWKGAKSKGTNEKKLARLESREQEAYSAMVRAAEEVEGLCEMRDRIAAKIETNEKEAQGEAQVSAG